MKKITLITQPPYTNGQVFNRENQIINRDNCLAFYHELKSKFQDNNYDLNTQDINRPDLSDFILYTEIPDRMDTSIDIEKSILLLFETDIIVPKNWDLKSHQYFKKIFTWDDRLIDNKKYFKFNFTVGYDLEKLKNRIEILEGVRPGFCTLISGNKTVKHPLELYSERLKTIRWFEDNHPNEFDLYGIGWDQFVFRGPFFIRALNRIAYFKRLFAQKRKSYKGMVPNKFDVLKNYTFSICYENGKNIPGYITEKIFDSMYSGCIPIYWGPSNIHEYIPEDCFIDRREFSSLEQLYTYLKSMSLDEIQGYQLKMYKYLQSKEFKPFCAGFMAERVVSEVLGIS